ncbi:MAG: SWIM zinc finger domain-containing protein [Gemmataceae bacterium]|nr:SWIM zinc finger domain-containing protein [Gemmataceae bacterium]
MDKRERKGILIAQRGDVAEDDRSYLVRSESRPDHEYRVYFRLKPTCDCEDFNRNGGYCKHIWAVHYAVVGTSTAHRNRPNGDDGPSRRPAANRRDRDLVPLGVHGRPSRPQAYARNTNRVLLCDGSRAVSIAAVGCGRLLCDFGVERNTTAPHTDRCNGKKNAATNRCITSRESPAGAQDAKIATDNP